MRFNVLWLELGLHSEHSTVVLRNRKLSKREFKRLKMSIETDQLKVIKIWKV